MALSPKPALVALLGALGVAAALAQTPVTLESSTLSVTLDAGFPRILHYTSKADGASIEAQAMPTASVTLNGRRTTCDVAFSRTAPDSADYRLDFADAKITATLHVTVGADTVELRLASVQELGSQRLHILTFPDDALLTLRSTQPNSAIAATLAYVADNNAQHVFRERVGPLAGMQSFADTANYFFGSSGSLAVGVADNGMTDALRTSYRVFQLGGATVCSVAMPPFQYREIDSETLDPPYVKVLLTGDRNGDGVADWQDAALVYREVMPMPLGSQFINQIVCDQIALEYASGAQQPFLRILDEMKKVYLATDGLGQQVQVKGFTSEGHDQANSDMYGHVNVRAGGQADLNVLIDKAHKINGRVGVHVNVSEVYPEARRYNPNLLLRDANGNPIGGWDGLDSAALIDKRKDVLSGGLYAELDGLHAAMPLLDFLYVDTYWDNGWVAYKLATKVNSLGLPLYTEGETALDPWTAWAHDNIQKSSVLRFLWYGRRDIFSDDPLLRSTNRLGFMLYDGSDFNAFIRNVFSRNLIARYLQNFDLRSWKPGESARFDSDVAVSKSGNVTNVTRGGRLVATWTGGGVGNRMFVPWDPKSESIIYVWDEVGTPQTWRVPPAWGKSGAAYLYTLTDTGRTNETKVPIVDGAVTLVVAKGVPYVLYPAPAPPEKPMAWGEGGLVKDPGFDSHGFTDWTRAGDVASVQIADDGRGKARLVIGGAAEVSQRIDGLRPGKAYAASAWIDVHGNRSGTVEVRPLLTGAQPVSNYSNDHIRHAFPADPRVGTGFTRVRVLVDMPAGCSSAILTLRADKGAPDSFVEFEDVRLVESGRSPEAAKHWFWEDFEHVDEGYGPFADCPYATTHLSEANPPYTSDVIAGRYSLKTRNEGRVLRTVPSSLRFKPNERYHLEMDTLEDANVTARISVEDEGRVLFQQDFAAGRGHVAGDFATRADGQAFIAVYKENKPAAKTLVIDNLAIDDLGLATPAVDAPAPDKDALAGEAVSFDEQFAAPLGADWTTRVSSQPDTRFAVADGALRITAHANTSAFAERKLPIGVAAVEARVDAVGDEGLSWGVGLALLWPGGQAVKVAFRNREGTFGVDSTAEPQVVGGRADADHYVVLRIRFEGDHIIGEARTDWGEWQRIALLPRAKFPGLPDRLRVGKMGSAGDPGDNGDPGVLGETAVYRCRIFTAAH